MKHSRFIAREGCALTSKEDPNSYSAYLDRITPRSRFGIPKIGMNRDFLLWASTFFIVMYATSAVIISILLRPILFPMDLIKAELRVYPLYFSIGREVFFVLVLLLLLWLYRRLRSPAIVEKQQAAGYAPPHIWGFRTGILNATLLAMLGLWMPHSGSALKAVELARLQMGPGYEFHVSHISWNPERTAVVLIAYNETEIKDIRVEWK